MKAYVVALPGPDGDGYLPLTGTIVSLLEGKALPSAYQVMLDHRFRVGERTANLPVGLFGQIYFQGSVLVFSTLDAARDWGLAWARDHGIREVAILCGEAEETRRRVTDLADNVLDAFDAVAFTPQEVVLTEKYC